MITGLWTMVPHPTWRIVEDPTCLEESDSLQPCYIYPRPSKAEDWNAKMLRLSQERTCVCPRKHSSDTRTDVDSGQDSMATAFTIENRSIWSSDDQWIMDRGASSHISYRRESNMSRRSLYSIGSHVNQDVLKLPQNIKSRKMECQRHLDLAIVARENICRKMVHGSVQQIERGMMTVDKVRRQLPSTSKKGVAALRIISGWWTVVLLA